MRIHSLGIALLFVCATGAISGCKTPTPSSGMRITSSDCSIDTAQGPCLQGTQRPVPHIPVSGTFTGDAYSGGTDLSQGTVKDFGFYVFGDALSDTGKGSAVIISNARTPGFWNMYALWQFNTFDGENGCGGLNYVGPVTYVDNFTYFEYEFDDQLVPNFYTAGGSYDFICHHVGGLLPASTRFAIIGSFPGTLTLSSETPFTTNHGMPLLYVYDGMRTVVATVTASSVSSDGSQATFPFPSGLVQNGYAVAVVNQTGSLPQAAGTNYLSIASSQTIAGNPFGVAAGSLLDSWVENNMCSGKLVKTTGSNSSNFPVVSLYSLNQVLVGSAVIGVGANPTAISLYSLGFELGPAPDPENCDKVTDKYTGTTRAVVANSGSNTISVLDIVNNVPIYTITVGNRPVALAVTTNGILSATAYVANYADSTVSQVDLKAGTTTATIPVGGQPTSVALTSGGVLWVGGVGFLTQINTANMSVVGTESAPAKSIIALGFSDSLNELIATSVDSAGSVYEDELAPGSFQAGAAYTPAASHSVSTTGTYTRQPSGQLVRAFTSTLVNNTSLSSFQVGAPPLVVQDGWAVVTATPTGFSITDASGHVVLVSEKTPSPVTAIAVDGGLKVAYLTLPDSNTLLTVPLPGVN